VAALSVGAAAVGLAPVLGDGDAYASSRQGRDGSQQELVLSEFVRLDPDKIMRAERCGGCHFSEHRVWSQTPHATGFDTLHRKDAAEQIAAAMGFRLIKRVSLCLKCHYTPMVQRGQLRAVEGVSCESCHGAAGDWVDVHADFGVRDPDLRVARSQETAAHREQRIAEARAKGMRRPSDLYDVAANCFECHMVPHEELVNAGGHSTGSGAFELVEWSQGQIRHNFLDSFLTGDGTVNAESSAARKRQMYVVGKALDLEYLLRGVALASEPGKYLSSLVRRKRRVVGDLEEIGESARVPEVNEMLVVVADADLRPDNATALEASADRLRQLTRAFIANHDGEQLAGLDPLYSVAAVTGEPADRPSDAAGENPAGGAAATTSQGADVPPAGAQQQPRGAQQPPGDAPSPLAGAQPPATPAPGATGEPTGGSEQHQVVPARVGETAVPVGAIQSWPPWRARPQHATLREVPCTSCHEHDDQVNWWYEDAHATAADALLDENPDYLRIAVAYGVGADGMTRGDQLCMQCHGTYATGREARQVNDGVGCQRCHGAGADYKDIHQDNPDRSLELGRVALDDLPARASTCAGCHYVTDPRLISVGHPTGADFDFVAANATIKHWETDAAPAALLAAFNGVIAERGPLPSVVVIAPVAEVPADTAAGGAADTEVANPVVPAGQTAAGQEAGAGPTVAGGADTRPTAGTRRQRANVGANPTPTPTAAEPTVRSVPPVATPSGEVLPPLVVPDNASVEETLLLIKQRLELLYRLVGGGR